VIVAVTPVDPDEISSRVAVPVSVVSQMLLCPSLAVEYDDGPNASLGLLLSLPFFQLTTMFPTSPVSVLGSHASPV
jgi:hypothetical protein